MECTEWEEADAWISRGTARKAVNYSIYLTANMGGGWEEGLLHSGATSSRLMNGQPGPQHLGVIAIDSASQNAQEGDEVGLLCLVQSHGKPHVVKLHDFLQTFR